MSRQAISHSERARTARAEQTPIDSRAILIARGEHIHIEAEPGTVDAPTPHRRRKVRSSYELKSRLRGCETEVSILEDHFVTVRAVRPDAQPRKYEFDLRFLNPKPVRVRSIARFWLSLTACMMLLAAGGMWFMFLRRTIESLEFVSMNGGATLLSVAGGIGSARAGKRFFIELIKNINAAKTARPQERSQLLRDEMREHHRLRELGVLSEQQYQQAKARILASH